MFFWGLETKLHYNFVQRKLPSPRFQVEVVLVDYDGSQPPKPAAGAVDNKSDADSSASTAVKENSVAPAESNKGTGSNDKDEVFSDSDDGEDGSSKERKERTAGGGQGSVNAAKPSQTSQRGEGGIGRC